MMKKLILSFLLHYANKVPPGTRDEFYSMKKKILERHGTLLGKQVQHIKKDCYRCTDGTHWTGNECWNCFGDGIYDEFWSLLLLYQLGKFRFHVFIRRISGPEFTRAHPEQPLLDPIEGYIRHSVPKYYLHSECQLWLYLFFDRKAFWHELTCSRPAKMVWLPMCAINILAYNLKNFKRKMNSKRMRRELLKQSGCSSYDDLPF